MSAMRGLWSDHAPEMQVVSALLFGLLSTYWWVHSSYFIGAAWVTIAAIYLAQALRGFRLRRR